jgi:hypothetical protein
MGGNYWTNSTSNGYSDTCTDSNRDGFCDIPYIIDPGQTGNNTDYLPLSYKYLYLEVILITPVPNIVTKVIQNTTFTVIANVTCRGGNCRNVQGTARYNDSSAYPDKAINSTLNAVPFYILMPNDLHPFKNESGSYREPDNPELAFDDGFNDTTTGAYFYAITPPGTDHEEIVYTWNFNRILWNATFFYTWKTDEAHSGESLGISYIYFYNWAKNDWEIVYYNGSDIPFGTYNLSMNSTDYFNSTGGVKVKFEARADIGGGGTGSIKIWLNDTYIHPIEAENAVTCANMNENDRCQLNWTVNATGNINTYWKIDVNFTSSFSYISSNDTNDTIIKIVSLPNIQINGISLYYYTGERVNGNVTVIPVETPDDKETSTVSNGEWSVGFNMDTENTQHYTVIIDDNQKIGYNEIKVDNPVTASLSCSAQDISLSGYSVDVNSGNSITSGNVKVSILDTDYTNTTTFSGIWSIDIHPCLIPGNLYTVQVLISDSTGKRGEFLQKYPAR